MTGMVLMPVPTDLTAVSLNEFEIVGSQIYGPQDFKRAVDWIDASVVPFRKLITHVLPLEKAEYGLNLLAQHQEDVAKILLEVKA